MVFTREMAQCWAGQEEKGEDSYNRRFQERFGQRGSGRQEPVLGRAGLGGGALREFRRDLTCPALFWYQAHRKNKYIRAVNLRKDLHHSCTD